MKQFAIIFLCLYKLPGYCQGKLITQAFFVQQQVCSVKRTTDNYFFIELNNDSTADASIYSCVYDGINQLKTKQAFTGKYSITGDSLGIDYTGQNFNCGRKNPFEIKFTKTGLSNYPIKDPSNKFVFKGESPISVDGLFPILQTIDIDKLGDLKLPFDKLK